MGTTSKNRFPGGGDLYVKNGSTETKFVTSTGGLYQEGVALPHSSQLAPLALVTWGSTVAQTLAGTTVAATLEHKTISNGSGWTVTTPTSASAATLALTPYGLNLISRSTAAGTQAYTLSLSGSVKGAPLWICGVACNSTDSVTVGTSAANLINYSTAGGGFKTITMTCPGSLVKLMCASTTLGWVLESVGTTLSTCAAGTTTLPTLSS